LRWFALLLAEQEAAFDQYVPVALLALLGFPPQPDLAA
jgi:hypothetical protein